MASFNGTQIAFHPDDLNLFHRNARRGDVDAIAESLSVNGQYAPITVNQGTKTGRPAEVLAGNHTLLAARKLGWDSIDAYVIDVDDAAAARININANKLPQLGGFDHEMLAAQLADFGDDLVGTGFKAEEVEALTASFGGPVEFPDDPAPAPAPPSEPSAPAPGPSSISLSGLPPRYWTWVGEKLAEIKDTNGLDSNADVVVMALMHLTGERPPQD